MSTIEESPTMALSAFVNRLKAEGKDVLNFNAGEPDYNTPEFIKKAAMKAIDQNFTRYTANEGHPSLIKAILNKFQKDNNLFYEPENILVSNGAKHSLYNILKAICNPGDEVIFQTPYWVSYPEMVKLVQANSVILHAGTEHNFKITPTQLENAITEKTKAFIFNTPSNPTGAVYSKEEIFALAEVVREKDIYVISDEIYEKITFDSETHFAIGSIDFMKDKTITINGVSKSYAMTGWRIGYAGGPSDVIKFARNLQSHSTSNACSVSQAAAIAALSEHAEEIAEMVKGFQQRRDLIVNELNQLPGVICPKPQGAFYVFFDVHSYYGRHANGYEINNSSSFCHYLLDEVSVGLVPGSAFGNDDCVRMSYACSLSDLEEGFKRIQKGLKKLN
ncbi:MAG TPA: aspartate aminotransferase [Bacteroidetes bacterium]|nr:aspartate aminotransferase [Bacteroidota bacterium]HRI46476.1 pyridoxal phosphate-dependent aminotransferase [Ignavibacteriaceae bacterium]